MRSIGYVLLICDLALTGCATKQKTSATTAQATSNIAPPRNDCPTGYHWLTSPKGSACAPKDTSEVEADCKPQQCGEWTVWDCYFDMVPDPDKPSTLHCFLPGRNEDGSIYVSKPIESSERTPTELDEFYAYLRQYLHGHPNPKETKAHLRYHAYWHLAEQFRETPSDTLMEDGRSRALAAEPWFEQTVLDDIQHCDADLARAAASVVSHFTRRGMLKGIVRVQRFRDHSLPENVRLTLLNAWLDAVVPMHGGRDGRADAAKIYSPVLDELERDDSSPLIQQAVPLYRDALANPSCSCGSIHWPNDRPHPMFVTEEGQVGNRQDPLLRIYEPEEAWPLPEPHEGGVYKGTCPHP